MQSESSAGKRTGLMWVWIHLKCSVALLEAAGRFNLQQALSPTGLSSQAPPTGRNNWAAPQLSTAGLYTGCLEAEIFLLGRTENLNSDQMRNQGISLPWWFFKDQKTNVSAICLGQTDGCGSTKLCEGLLFKCALLTRRHCPVCKLTKNIFSNRYYPLTH